MLDNLPENQNTNETPAENEESTKLEADHTNVEGSPEIPKASETENVVVDRSRETGTLPPDDKGLKHRLKHFGMWLKSHKKITAILLLIFLLLVILGIPVTRYAVLSLFKSQTVDVAVHDSQTGQPVTEADVLLNNKQVKTNKKGIAEFTHTKLGKTTIHITKTYYKETDLSYTVGLSKPPQIDTKLTATGRQVPITITNKINGQAISDALIEAIGSKTRTDQQGKATLVLPADRQTVSATVSANGYNNANVTVKVIGSVVPDNNFSVLPSGKIYFLSKLSGNIDVVKTNLDGSNRQVVVAGTGTEDDRGTVLLASKDWQYLVLLSKRDSSPAKLYLINTSNDHLSTIDEGNATFTITGWLGHDFIYSVNRGNVSYWQASYQLLKGYNADTGKLTVLDQTNAEGPASNDYASEAYGQIYALNGTVLFSKNWQAAFSSPARLNGKQASIVSIKADGTSKSVLKTLSQPNNSGNLNVSFDSVAYDSGGVYFNDNVDSNVYKYDEGSLNSTSEVSTGNLFTKVYPTFLQSPDSKQNFWSESRDGKNTLFVGDDKGLNGQQIATLSDYTQYGWYTNNYLLVSKNSSELYIMAKDGKHNAIKISDYHKPVFNYYGYGGGYGGI